MKDLIRPNHKSFFFITFISIFLAVLSLGGAYIMIGGVNAETAALFALVSILVFYFPKIYIQQ